jgi:hypothetical protein
MLQLLSMETMDIEIIHDLGEDEKVCSEDSHALHRIGEEVPERMLDDYEGFLVTDGYKAYASVTDQSGITGIGCWAHARRKFDEALMGYMEGVHLFALATVKKRG